MVSVESLVGRAGAVRFSVELVEVDSLEVLDSVDSLDVVGVGAELVVCGRDE